MEQSIISYFSQMKAPRILRKQLHPLENIVFITIAGVMSGCESWDDIEDYGNAKKEWLGSFLALKENQKGLLDNVLSSFSLFTPAEVYIEEDFGHGRIETRKCSVITDLKHIDQRYEWKNLQSIIRIDSQRIIKATGKVEQEQRFYISTHTNAEKIGKSIRSHWGIENKLHWLLDVAMNEDESTKRSGYASQNFSIINKICLNLLKKNERKMGIRRKRNLSGWDNEYLLELLKF